MRGVFYLLIYCLVVSTSSLVAETIRIEYTETKGVVRVYPIVYTPIRFGEVGEILHWTGKELVWTLPEIAKIDWFVPCHRLEEVSK